MTHHNAHKFHDWLWPTTMVASAALILVAAGCEVGEASDFDIEETELESLVDSEDEGLEVGFAANCLHAQFTRSGNRITGYAIDLCFDTPNRLGEGPLGARSVFMLKNQSQAPGTWYTGQKSKAHPVGRCRSHVRGFVGCLPNEWTTVNIDGVEYSGMYGFDFELLGPDVWSRATPFELRVYDSAILESYYSISVPLSMGTFPSSGGGTTTGTVQRTLTIGKYGTAQVAVDEPGLDCSGTVCKVQVPDGASIRVENSALGRYYSGIYGSGCSGGKTCTLVMNSDRSISAFTY